MPQSKEEKTAYNIAYAAENMKQIKFNLHKEHDKAIIEHLAGIKNKQGYIKTLILADMEGSEKI